MRSSTRPIRLLGPDGRTDRLVGYSPTARMVIVVIYLREELIGVNAWKANESQARRYWNRT